MGKRVTRQKEQCCRCITQRYKHNRHEFERQDKVTREDTVVVYEHIDIEIYKSIDTIVKRCEKQEGLIELISTFKQVSKFKILFQ